MKLRLFIGLFGLLLLCFYFMPDQAGRNLMLYAAALSAHALLPDRRAWSFAYGHSGGWCMLILVLVPCLSLLWSTGADADTSKDMLIAAYCLLAIYFGAATVVRRHPQLVDNLPLLMLLAGNITAAVAVIGWALMEPTRGSFRLQGVWGLDNPVHASVLLLATAIVPLHQIVRAQRSGWWTLALIMPVIFVLLTGARMAAAVFVLVVLGLVASWRPRAAGWVLLGVAGIAAAAIAVLGTGVMAEVWVARGLSYRDIVWEQVLMAYEPCSAWFGCGIGTPLDVDIDGREGTRAHSIYLAALYHQGVVGLLLFVGALAWLLRSAVDLQAGRRGHAWAWMLVYVLLANVTSGSHILVRASLFWPAFWIPVMVLAARSRGSSSATAP